MFMVSLTLILKVLGFIREMVMANFYGTNFIVDAYVMANAIPNILLGGIFASVATSYTPVFSTIHEKNGELASNKFTSQVINLLILLSIAAILIGILFSDELTAIFASGFSGETAKLTSLFIRITLAGVLFSSVAGIMDAYMQYKGHFLKPIISAYFQNIGVICIVIFSAYTSHYYLALGLLIGSFFRLLYISTSAGKVGYHYDLNFSLGEPIRSILHMAVPVFIGSYILQINSFVDKTLASSLPEGTVSALNYAMILITLITGLTVTLLVTFIYPKLTKAFTLTNLNAFNAIVEKGTGIIALITIPISIGILAFDNEVVQIVYERGAFNPIATDKTSEAFLFYGIGLFFFALNDLLAKVFYAMRDAKAPIVCSGISVIINIILNLLLIGSMAHKGLALSTSIAAIINTLLLLIWMNKKHPKINSVGSWIKILKIIVASSISVSVVWCVNNFLISTIWMPRIGYLSIAVLCASGIYILLLKIFRVEDIKILKELLLKGNSDKRSKYAKS
ncbi:murein biosynthesis integral membrane protein MurJ [Macellibacteroides fermentans]|uniref:murein biosynthesis integral membrane protein MurJ n=1 Tax=Macellibacteroides fermentans TaxID=879969 RepID=UPI00406C9964